MKIAVVYNRESQNVINLFGIPNREKYGKQTIKKVTDALKKGGHQVATFEADKMLIEHLEEFMPSVVKGETPGLVFNLSYGIQGQARYTHVPSILEMVGIPYTGSGPMAHSLSLDKVVAKMIFRQRGVPTPDFAVLETPEATPPDLAYPLIVKPKDEAVSFGLRIVHNETELLAGAGTIFEKFHQPVLVERYIEGREINVALLGNDPPLALPPVELIFGEGPAIYTEDDKKHKSGREVEQRCPADLPTEVTEQAKKLAISAFQALGCRDSARVDMRIDEDWNIFILEVNSLASLGAGGSLPAAARQIGMDYPDLINRLVEVASARYFGTDNPPILVPHQRKKENNAAFDYIVKRRDLIEKQVQKWCEVQSRTHDPVGSRRAIQKLEPIMAELSLKPSQDFADNRSSWLWTTIRGHEGGTLLVAHIDVPLPVKVPTQVFRKTPEFLGGEGIGVSRGPLVVIEYALRALKAQKVLDKLRLGVMVYADEGRDARYSEQMLANTADKAGQMLVMGPQMANGQIISGRRGYAKFLLLGEGKPTKLGQPGKEKDVFTWLASKIKDLTGLSSRQKRMGVGVVDIKLDCFPLFLPHAFEALITVSYYHAASYQETVASIKSILGEGAKEVSWKLEEISHRPPMRERSINKQLADSIIAIAENWDIHFSVASSLWPSVAGLAPAHTPVVCGMGPAAEEPYTPAERIHRISLIQQSLILSQFLLNKAEQS